MARLNQTTAVNIRIPNGLLKILDEDITLNEEFASRTDYIVCAIKFFEEHRTKLLSERAIAKAAQTEEDFISSSQRSVDSVRDEK
jgi:hypothetical protein